MQTLSPTVVFYNVCLRNRFKQATVGSAWLRFPAQPVFPEHEKQHERIRIWSIFRNYLGRFPCPEFTWLVQIRTNLRCVCGVASDSGDNVMRYVDQMCFKLTENLFHFYFVPLIYAVTRKQGFLVSYLSQYRIFMILNGDALCIYFLKLGSYFRWLSHLTDKLLYIVIVCVYVVSIEYKGQKGTRVLGTDGNCVGRGY